MLSNLTTLSPQSPSPLMVASTILVVPASVNAKSTLPGQADQSPGPLMVASTILVVPGLLRILLPTRMVGPTIRIAR